MQMKISVLESFKTQHPELATILEYENIDSQDHIENLFEAFNKSRENIQLLNILLLMCENKLKDSNFYAYKTFYACIIYRCTIAEYYIQTGHNNVAVQYLSTESKEAYENYSEDMFNTDHHISHYHYLKAKAYKNLFKFEESYENIQIFIAAKLSKEMEKSQKIDIFFILLFNNNFHSHEFVKDYPVYNTLGRILKYSNDFAEFKNQLTKFINEYKLELIEDNQLIFVLGQEKVFLKFLLTKKISSYSRFKIECEVHSDEFLILKEFEKLGKIEISGDVVSVN